MSVRTMTALGAAALLALGPAACGGDDDEESAATTETAPAETTETRTTETGTTETGTTETQEREGSGDDETVRVSLVDFAIEPSSPRIERPGTVTFRVRNDGQAPHALEVEGPEGEVETEVLQPGGRATLTADLGKPGTYTWYCPVGDHEQRGMKGSITVRPS